MDVLWISYGFLMVLLGCPTVFIGFAVIFAWSSCGNPRVPPMDVLRVSYGFLMVLLGFPTVFIGFAMIFA